MATARKKTAHKSLVSNPPRSRYTTRKRTSSARRRKRNPSTALTKRARTNPARRRRYTRNPGASTNAAILAIGGALVITGFDEVVNRFMPAISGPIRIGAKVAAGWAVGNYGKKFLGSWAAIAQNALWLAAALDGFNAYVRPMLGGWLTPAGAPPVVQQQQIESPTGDLGMRYFLADGTSMDVYDATAQQYAY